MARSLASEPARTHSNSSVPGRINPLCFLCYAHLKLVSIHPALRHEQTEPTEVDGVNDTEALGRLGGLNHRATLYSAGHLPIDDDVPGSLPRDHHIRGREVNTGCDLRRHSDEDGGFVLVACLLVPGSDEGFHILGVLESVGLSSLPRLN